MYWYAISTKPHQDDLAELNLRRMGVETFNPQVKQHKIIRRKKRVCTSPLFPGYLFAKFSMGQHYRNVLYTRGVRRVVAFGEQPAIVDEALIEAIKCRLCEGFFATSESHFMPGQVVRIQEGPLRGLEAIFEKQMTGPQRAVLLLRALSYQARVVMDLGDIVNL